MGWVNAMRDARSKAVIAPQTIDLSGHDVIYLGSPIWLYSPAPPIWQFVQQNRFDGKRVVLLNTFNSRLSPSTSRPSGNSYCSEVPVPSSTSSSSAAEWAGNSQEMLDTFDAKWVS